MRRASIRLRFTLVLLAWFAQLCLPVVHASIMGAPRAELLGWCGDPAHALAIAAELPAEIRAALDLDGAGADHLSSCDKFCATGAAPPMLAIASTVVLRAAIAEPTPAAQAVPRVREQSPRPPSQGPPAQA